MHIEVYQRADGKWAFRVKANNGQIVGTDGGQGYENRKDAEDAVKWLTGTVSRALSTYTFKVIDRVTDG